MIRPRFMQVKHARRAFAHPTILPIADGWVGCMDNWKSANRTRSRIPIQASQPVTSCSGQVPVASKNPIFHLSRNPNRKITVAFRLEKFYLDSTTIDWRWLSANTIFPKVRPVRPKCSRPWKFPPAPSWTSLSAKRRKKRRSFSLDREFATSSIHSCLSGFICGSFMGSR